MREMNAILFQRIFNFCRRDVISLDDSAENIIYDNIPFLINLIFQGISVPGNCLESSSADIQIHFRPVLPDAAVPLPQSVSKPDCTVFSQIMGKKNADNRACQNKADISIPGVVNITEQR